MSLPFQASLCQPLWLSGFVLTIMLDSVCVLSGADTNAATHRNQTLFTF